MTGIPPPDSHPAGAWALANAHKNSNARKAVIIGWLPSGSPPDGSKQGGEGQEDGAPDVHAGSLHYQNRILLKGLNEAECTAQDIHEYLLPQVQDVPQRLNREHDGPVFGESLRTVRRES
jgi:hypothetical protein